MIVGSSGSTILRKRENKHESSKIAFSYQRQSLPMNEIGSFSSKSATFTDENLKNNLISKTSDTKQLDSTSNDSERPQKKSCYKRISKMS